MGRGKIEIKRIENATSRQVTFSKRRAGLIKKAQELSILCDAEVALIIFSTTGKLFEFASSSMKRTLSRYNKSQDCTDMALVEHDVEKQHFKEINILKDEISKLRMAHRRMMGKELTGLSFKELQHLEHQLNEGILSVKSRKEQLLLEQLEQSRLQEKRTMQENGTLSKQVEELRALLPKIEEPKVHYLEFHPMERKQSQLTHYTESSDMGCNCNFEKHRESDTSLQLGHSGSQTWCLYLLCQLAPIAPCGRNRLLLGSLRLLRSLYSHLRLPSEVYCKRKAPERASSSFDSGTETTT